MGVGSGDDRFAPPQAHVADVEEPVVGLVLASRGRRLAAVLLETVVILFLFWVVSRLTPWNPFESSNRDYWSPQWRSFFWNVLVFLLLNAFLLATRGQTVGKVLLGMRIVRTDGAPVSPLRLFGLRYGVGYLMNIVLGIGMVYAVVDSLLIFHKSKRCLHDHMADTVVIKV